jgi:hypothetical protein
MDVLADLDRADALIITDEVTRRKFTVYTVTTLNTSCCTAAFFEH